jgi:hypothetical protein
MNTMGIGELVSGFGEKVKAAAVKAVDFIHAHRIYALCAVAGVFIILVLLIILEVVRHAPEKQAPVVDRSAGAFERSLDAARPALSPEDFFMPDEPDFVPEVLLGREPRDGWSEEDARPFWTDPLEGREDEWQAHIKNDVDSMLEAVP